MAFNRKEYHKQYVATHREQYREADRRHRIKRKQLGMCLKCALPSIRSSVCAKHYMQQRLQYQKRRDKIKGVVFSHYGPNCRCCGEGQSVFLTLDHIDGNGAAERKKLFGKKRAGTGMPTYEYLVKSGLPDGYQVLCWNCNWAKHALGECFHQSGLEFDGHY